MGVETEQVAPLDERDAALVNEPTNVAHLDTERIGDFGDRQQPVELSLVLRGLGLHRVLLVW